MPLESDKWGWKHVSVFGGFDKGSGTKRWKCNHCNLRYNGSYSRVRAHLLGFTGVGVKSCPAIDRSLREAFYIFEEEWLAQRKRRTSINGKPGKSSLITQSNFSLAQKKIAKEDVDDIVARFFYADGVNVNVVDSPYFHEMAKKIAAFGPGYEPPSAEKLSDFFLSKEKGKIEKSLTLVRESWPRTGCTILCVGQLDGKLGCFHINIFVSSPRGHIFVKAVDIDDSHEGSDNLFTSALSEAIMEVGPTNVTQIIAHLGHACETYESLVFSKFPHIFWSPCTLLSIRMLMEEIAELDWIRPIVLCAKEIEQCIMTYQHSSACVFTIFLGENSDQPSSKFAPSFCTVQRIFELKQALQDVVVSEEWKQWKLTVPQDVISIETAILGDDIWNRAEILLQLLEPFLRLLTNSNIEKSVMGDVYSWWVQAVEALRTSGIDHIALNQLEVLIENRWDILFSPLHAAGYILNPRYFGRGQTKDKTIMRGWKTTLERYKCESLARRVLREQLSCYWKLEGSFSDEDAVDSRDKMDPVAWWENFGFETPDLQTLAVKILSQVSTVTLCQEICEVNDFPSQEMANKLVVERLEDLVFVRNNLRLHKQRNGNSSALYSQRSVNSSFVPVVETSDSPCLDQIEGIVNIHNNEF